MLQRAGEKIDSKEAVLKIKDASYPEPFASELEYNSPVHGNWNIVHTGMQVPESIQIYVCADNVPMTDVQKSSASSSTFSSSLGTSLRFKMNPPSSAYQRFLKLSTAIAIFAAA